MFKTLTTTLASFHAPHQQWPHLERLNLADPDFLKPRSIDIIIGADSYGQIIKPNIIKHSPSMPIAQFSSFGWIVLGPVNQADPEQLASHRAKVEHDNSALYGLIAKFWIQEESPVVIDNQLTPEE